MKNSLHRESLLTILVVAALAAAFLLGIYFPGQKATAQVRAEIAEAEQAIRDVPRRLAELKSLQMEIDRRQAYLTRNGNLIPPDVHMHEVLSRVSQLARAASLSVTRLEPLPPVPLETCERRPFRLSFSGQFRDLMIFLHGLEGQPRLFSVDELTLNAAEQSADGKIAGELRFSVYAGRRDFADFSDFVASSAARSTD